MSLTAGLTGNDPSSEVMTGWTGTLMPRGVRVARAQGKITPAVLAS